MTHRFWISNEGAYFLFFFAAPLLTEDPVSVSVALNVYMFTRQVFSLAKAYTTVVQQQRMIRSDARVRMYMIASYEHE